MTARTRLIAVFAVGLLATLLEHGPALGALAGVSAVALARSGAPWARPLALAVLAAATSTIASQALFWQGSPRTALVELGPVAVWREGVGHGAVQSLRFVAASLAGASLAASTPPDRLASGLAALGVPAGAAFLATTALRFVPTALEEWRVVRALRARRVPTPPWRPDRLLLRELAVLRPVAARAVRRSAVLAESLELRGYDPARTPLAPDAEPGWRDRVAVAALVVLVGAVAVSRLVFWAWTRGLVTDPALRPWMGFVRWWC